MEIRDVANSFEEVLNLLGRTSSAEERAEAELVLFLVRLVQRVAILMEHQHTYFERRRAPFFLSSVVDP